MNARVSSEAIKIRLEKLAIRTAAAVSTLLQFELHAEM
jgi:hypothetical protein